MKTFHNIVQDELAGWARTKWSAKMQKKKACFYVQARLEGKYKPY